MVVRRGKKAEERRRVDCVRSLSRIYSWKKLKIDITKGTEAKKN